MGRPTAGWGSINCAGEFLRFHQPENPQELSRTHSISYMGRPTAGWGSINCAGAGQPGRVWQARTAPGVAMLPGEAGINVRKTARYASKDCDPLQLAYGVRPGGLQDRPGNPVAGQRIQVFVDPRDHRAVIPLEVLRLRVDLEDVEVIAFAYELLPVVLEQVGHRRQRDRCGHGPAWTVPLALMAFVRQRELRTPPLRRRWTPGRVEAIRVHKLLPGRLEPGVGQIHVPWRVADQLSYPHKLRVRPARKNLEELRVLVPQPFLNETFDVRALRAELFGHIGSARQCGDIRDGPRIGEHVAVDRGPVTAASNGHLHPVAVVDLPEQTFRTKVGFLPLLVVRQELGQQVLDLPAVARREITVPQRVGNPEAVAAYAAALAQPEDGIVVEVAGVAEPAPFVVMESGGAVNGVTLPRPRHIRQKLRDDESVGRLPEVLAVRPPAEVVDLLQRPIRALE